jgi:hypothetical protein
LETIEKRALEVVTFEKIRLKILAQNGKKNDKSNGTKMNVRNFLSLWLIFKENRHFWGNIYCKSKRTKNELLLTHNQAVSVP